MTQEAPIIEPILENSQENSQSNHEIPDITNDDLELEKEIDASSPKSENDESSDDEIPEHVDFKDNELFMR